MITNKTEYALRALGYLAARPQVMVKSSEIALQQKIPPKFLPQILNDLCRAGILDTVRGSKGGVRLKKNPKDVKIGQVVEAIQGPLRFFPCVEEAFFCSLRNRCSLKPVWSEAHKGVLKTLNKFRLKDIIVRERIKRFKRKR